MNIILERQHYIGKYYIGFIIIGVSSSINSLVHVIISLSIRPGDQATCWYYILNGSVLISTSYIYSSGCSFGQCVDTNFRTDTCLVSNKSELLRVSLMSGCGFT